MDNFANEILNVFERIWAAQGRSGTFADFVAQHAAASEEDRIRRNVKDYNNKRGELNEIDGYDCKKCLNKGDIWEAVNCHGTWKEIAYRCDCWKVRTSILRMRRSGLENSMHRLNEFEVTEDWQRNMKDTAKAYLATDHSNGETLFLGGAVGCGKTFIGSAVCRELLLMGHEVVYMPWVNEAQRLKALANADNLADEIATYSKAEYLYIDDLFKPLPGQTAPTPADVRLAYDIINYRYINKLPMIISCEKYITELLDLDEATISRVYERAKGYTVSIGRGPGRNYRMKGADVII